MMNKQSKKIAANLEAIANHKTAIEHVHKTLMTHSHKELADIVARLDALDGGAVAEVDRCKAATDLDDSADYVCELRAGHEGDHMTSMAWANEGDGDGV